jgi:hypothetical protein
MPECRFGTADRRPPRRRWSFSAERSHTHSRRRRRWRPTSNCGAYQLRIGADELLYARADVIGGPGHAELVGLDLVAPSLGWQLLGETARDDAQRQFALCVESALDRFGLGPLSHRRP